MARITTLQTNFTAGELSPRVLGRTDIDRYNSGARVLLNCHPMVHGGARRRAGTRYVAPLKTAATAARMIPFVYSRSISYMIEMGNGYLRVYTAGGTYTGVELVSPYTTAHIAEVDFVQGADTMFLAHPAVPMQRLRRFSGTSWDLAPVPFVTQPFDEQGHTGATGLTLSLATVGTGRTATAGAATFLPSDVGRDLVSAAGLATITGYTSSTVVTITITIAFAGTALASGAWKLDGSPFAIIAASATGPDEATITLAGALTRAADLTLSATTGAITVTASAAIFVAGDVGKTIYADSGVALISGFTDSTHVSASTSADFAGTTYSSGGWGITDSVWRSGDVGSFVRLAGGLARITAFTSASLVSATVARELDHIIMAPPLAWSLETSVWSAAAGYPATVTLHEQRLIAAGSTAYPQTIWGSKTGEYLDFTTGTADADAFSFTIASDELSPIAYMVSARNLIAHTYSTEYSLQGGIEKPINPTNIRIRPESNYGTKLVRPVAVGKESVYVQRSGRKLRAVGYDAARDGYLAPDITVLAEHITESGITDLAYQQEPDTLLWATRGDGALVSCTVDRDQGVIGWARHITDGAVEAVCTIPNGDADEVWLICRRTVNGATVRLIEILDSTWQPLLPSGAPAGYPPVAAPVVYGYTVDCGLAFDNVAGQTVFSVPHLIGKTVDIVADGAVMPAQVVPASGNITLTRASFRTLIGLHYQMRVEMLTPEAGTGTGSAQGNSMRVSEISVRFLDTLGAEVTDGDSRKIAELTFRKFGTDVLDRAPNPFTGIKRTESLGWERGRADITIVQDQPLPMHVLAVMRKYQVND